MRLAVDRIVAIKISHEKFSQRSDREVRAVAAVRPPTSARSTNYLLMEHVDGTPLKGPMPVEQALLQYFRVSLRTRCVQ